MGEKPHTPKYDTSAALNEQQRLNQAAGYQKYANINSPLGGYSVSVDPDTGKMTIDKTLSANSQSALDIQNKLLNEYIVDPAEAANAYYTRQMQYVTPTFEQQVANAEQSLADRGIQMGSDAWNKAMNAVYDAQGKATAMMENNALLNGQQYQTELLNQAANAQGLVYDPAMVEGANGAGLYNTYDKKYESDVAKYKSKLADYNSLQSVLFPSVGSILGGTAGAIASNNGSANNATTGGQITDIYGNVIGQKGGYGQYNG